MKTKLPLLLILTALMLSSCGNGSEIKDEQKVNELKASIAEKVNEHKNYEITVNIKSSRYDEELKKNVTNVSETFYQKNEAGDTYLKTTGTNDGVKSESIVYLVNNEQYTQVLYTSNYYGETNENETSVYGYEGNEITFSFASFYFIVPETYLSMFENPLTADINAIANAEDSVKYDVVEKYYSKGDGYLTIKADVKINGESSEEEYATKAAYTVEYDNYHLSSVKVEQTSNKNNKSTIDFKLTLKDKLTIELPSGWEELINKDSGESEIDF